jgi:hypothetical protein
MGHSSAELCSPCPRTTLLPVSPAVQLRRQILESDTATAPESFSRLCDSPQELGMVLQPIIEPVVVAFEADQHASWLPVARDEDFLGLGQAQESRQVVLDLS